MNICEAAKRLQDGDVLVSPTGEELVVIASCLYDNKYVLESHEFTVGELISDLWEVENGK